MTLRWAAIIGKNPSLRALAETELRTDEWGSWIYSVHTIIHSYDSHYDWSMTESQVPSAATRSSAANHSTDSLLTCSLDSCTWQSNPVLPRPVQLSGSGSRGSRTNEPTDRAGILLSLFLVVQLQQLWNCVSFPLLLLCHITTVTIQFRALLGPWFPPVQCDQVTTTGG